MDVFLIVSVLTVPLGDLVTPDTPVVVIFAPFTIFSGALVGPSAGQIFRKEETVGFTDSVIANLIGQNEPCEQSFCDDSCWS